MLVDNYDGKTIKAMEIRNKGYIDEHVYIEFITGEVVEFWNDNYNSTSLGIDEYKKKEV